MRFETDVLTRSSCWCTCNMVIDIYRVTPEKTRGAACRSEILASGWLLPDHVGARIVLVFSTIRVAGASTCWGWQLAFAGRNAMNKAGLDHRGHLWWWPEIVMGGE